MSKLKARLKRLEDALVGATTCLRCAPGQITLHQEYELPDGETVTLPPFPKLPPCTCRNPEMKIAFVVFRHPGQVPSREEDVGTITGWLRTLSNSAGVSSAGLALR